MPTDTSAIAALLDNLPPDPSPEVPRAPSVPYLSIEQLLDLVHEPCRTGCLQLLEENRARFETAHGSVHNHQAWPGGYLDHVTEVMNIAVLLYPTLSAARTLPFTLSSALLVLYLHDVEKPWKYEQSGTDGTLDEIALLKGDKLAQHFFREGVLRRYGINLIPKEANAFRYVEGELDEYDNRRRVMNELAGFCHACDVLSARLWHAFPSAEGDPWSGARRHG